MLSRSILKTRLWLILEFLILSPTVAVILVLGFSPGLLSGYLLKESYGEWFAPILLLGGIVCTLIAFCLIGTHDKINSFLDLSIKSIKQSYQDINESKFLIACIKKVKHRSLTCYEENELEKFLKKLKVSIKEL